MVRVLYTTSEHNEIIFEALRKVPIWVTNGERLRIYWSENHQIMYSSNAYLLRQRFASEFPPDFFDDQLDARLDWLLTTKPETGYFEYNSHIYAQFSLAGFLNLYDLAEDEAIKEAAYSCIFRLLSDWVQLVNSYGVVAAAAGRTRLGFFLPEDALFGTRNSQLMAMITGRGPLFAEFNMPNSTERPRIGTAGMFHSDFDLAPIAAQYRLQVDLTYQIGLSVDEAFKSTENLTQPERALTFLTMGSYAHPSYFNDFTDFVSFYDLFAHPEWFFLSPFFALPTASLRSLVSTIAGSFSVGTLHYAPEFVFHKNRDVTLSSVNNFFPGNKGFQQYPIAAAVADTAIFLLAMDESSFDVEERSQAIYNNQMPLLKQTNNVAVALYNPNADLEMFLSFIFTLDVLVYFDRSLYDEVVDNGESWVFARRDDAYVAIFRHCIPELNRAEPYILCKDSRQAWILVVGNDLSHESFELFQEKILLSTVLVEEENNCISLQAEVDDKEFSEEFCQKPGNLFPGIACLASFFTSFEVPEFCNLT